MITSRVRINSLTFVWLTSVGGNFSLLLAVFLTRLFVEARILRNQRTGPALRQALTKLAEAERLRVELGDKLGQIEVIKYIGITNQVVGDQQAAIATYQRGIPLTKEVGAVEEEAIIYNNLGFIYYFAPGTRVRPAAVTDNGRHSNPTLLTARTGCSLKLC